MPATSAGMTKRRSEKSQRLAAGAGAEARLDASSGDADDVHGAVALAGNKQFLAAERHVHGLLAHRDRRLAAKRRIHHAHRIALEAGHPDEPVVRAVAGDLRRLRDPFETNGIAHG